MKRSILAVALFLAVGSVGFGQTQVAAPATQAVAPKNLAQVPVKRVVLFSSGVGFFEHQGVVNGNEIAELRFKTEQINDILKSLVLSDRDGGQVRTVTYPSMDPLSRTLKSFQIDISDNPPMSVLLNQIRGTKVSIIIGDDKVEGTILGVESKERVVGKEEKVVETWTVNVITPTGIRSVPLDDVRKLDIQDPTLQNELTQALQALVQVRDKDKKPVLVNFDGQGQRHVAMGYVVETPIWKTTYRLILPDPTSRDTAKLLGWAVIENQTDNDWNEVSLDLVGGRPLAFIENLYQPLYVPRPVINPRVQASLRPQTYDRGMDASTSPPQIDLQKVTASGNTGGGMGGALFTDASGAKAADQPISASDFGLGVSSIATTSKIGQAFHYNVDKVTLARQRSAMIPIITEPVEFDRVSIYNASALQHNPLLGVRLKNKTDKYLLSGPVAVLDTTHTKVGENELIGTAYAGDASIDDVPAGQERLLSYAVDQEVLIDSTHHGESSELVTGSIVKGVLHLKFKSEITQDYVVDNKGAHEKSVVLEHPVSEHFELMEPAKPLEKTDTMYRFSVVVPPKKQTLLHVRQEWLRGEEVALLPLDTVTLETYFRQGPIPKTVKDALAAIIHKKGEVWDFQEQKQHKANERTLLLEEEGNLRENIKVLAAGSKSQQDQMNELIAREENVKRLSGEIKELDSQIAKSTAELNKLISELNVE